MIRTKNLMHRLAIAFARSVFYLQFAWFAVSAHAQSESEVQTRIEQLQKQINALQRKVFDADTPYFSSSDQADGTLSDVAPTPAAQMVRLDSLEATLRALTGQIEEIRFQQQQLGERLETFMAQTNYRLNALDGAGEGAVGSDASVASTSQAADAARADFARNFQDPDAPLRDAAPGSQAAARVSNAAVSNALENQETRQPPTATEAQPVSIGTDPKAQFEEAFTLVRRNRLDDAEQAFLAFLADHPQHALASNAQYWLGRVYTAKKQQSQAAEAFFEGYRRYPEGNKAPENLLAFAATLRQMDKPKEACTALTLLKSKIAENAYPSLSRRVQQGIASESDVLSCS
ncbi:MAG: tetratricopeptide repeat protein [Pseudomonadota bacterium]